MDQQQIKVLIDAMASSDLQEMEFSQDGWTLRLSRQGSATRAADSPSAAAPASPAANASRPSPAPVGRAAPEAAQKNDAAIEKELRAPLFGVLHLQPAPDEPPFVVVGQAIEAGQTVCVIEAMKVFNEVRAEHAAIVDAVLVGSGQEVEAGQALLRLR